MLETTAIRGADELTSHRAALAAPTIRTVASKIANAPYEENQTMNPCSVVAREPDSMMACWTASCPIPKGPAANHVS